jgi:hypothetical protein
MSGRARELVVRRFRPRAPAPLEDAEDPGGAAEDPAFAAAFARSRCARACKAPTRVWVGLGNPTLIVAYPTVSVGTQ